ncbi:RNA-binding protein 4B-like [Kryptolebias marmoratus]|uniref:RNA binding motif protein 4.3 n=1 Tax=Kryptolebias marmoratus TaxID=37003 RepID=A0A3Q3ARK6_KRYMA|nr:RNA-binding protein 4B-like [Kryptolebias marmoratus]XP_037832623.1 RNA-binding protein 4B-like [Kryptolebias marmoratus]XP_037832624.1 RNA-binding protein 4B-like [Kryptolebias marmoratus]XP_037832625.1 RNA-binding protein 4B-like [Kryptolebias marmoratus]
MVKIFIGNLSPNTEKDEIEVLFAKYGTVTECAKYKNYAFVHMEDRKCATKAIRELHLHKLDGRPINVEPSRGRNQGPVKLHIANVERGFDTELRELFEEYGEVMECVIIKNFAFVHMSNYDEAMDALQGLDNTEFKGKHIHVQVSKSKPRGGPEEEEEEEYPPPPGGRTYYPPPYPAPRPEPPYRGRMSAFPPTLPPPPLPPPPPLRRPPYLNRGYGDRDPYGVVDYYEKYRARPYSAASYDDRRSIPPPPPPPSALVRARLGAGSLDPYERRPLPPPPSYGVRDRSPVRRVLLPPAPSAGNGYFERSRLSPVSRAPVYPPPRSRDGYPERAPPPPPPPPPPSRYTGY